MKHELPKKVWRSWIWKLTLGVGCLTALVGWQVRQHIRARADVLTSSSGNLIERRQRVENASVEELRRALIAASGDDIRLDGFYRNVQTDLEDMRDMRETFDKTGRRMPVWLHNPNGVFTLTMDRLMRDDADWLWSFLSGRRDEPATMFDLLIVQFCYGMQKYRSRWEAVAFSPNVCLRLGALKAVTCWGLSKEDAERLVPMLRAGCESPYIALQEAAVRCMDMRRQEQWLTVASEYANKPIPEALPAPARSRIESAKRTAAVFVRQHGDR